MSRWSNNGKPPGEQCCGRIHIFDNEDNDHSEGTICQCGKMVWHMVRCERCGHLWGRAILIHAGNGKGSRHE